MLIALVLICGLLAGAALAVLVLRRSREQMREQLTALSAEVLAKTGETLAQRVDDTRRAEEERADGKMARHTEEIKGVMTPVAEKLTRMEGEIGRLERERREAQGQLAEMIRALGEGVGTLREEAGNLATALKRPSTRGAWGEIQLRNVVEMAGMVDHCDFLAQHTINGEDGALRPDMLVRLPGGKVVVVDSKVPLDAYLSSVESSSEQEREIHALRHARQTREHITKLASKGYQRALELSPEFVVMFIPSDGIYQAALAQDPALIEYGVSQQVLLATPTTLIGLLWAVHYGWRQELIAQSAREIADCGRELHHRLGRFVEPFSKLGRQLDSAVGAYNDAVGSFDQRVMPQVRRIEQAGAGSGREVDAPPGIEVGARTITARVGGAQDPPAPAAAGEQTALPAAAVGLSADA